MHLILLSILAFAMGFLTAIPVGATQIEIAKRSLNNQLRSAFMVVLGSVSSDLLYGAIAFFGLAPFLEDPTVVAVFGLAGAFILLALAFFTFKESVHRPAVAMKKTMLKSKRLAFLTGFSLAITNPIMILWWLIGAKIVRDLGLVQDFRWEVSTLFLLFGGLGLAAYLSTLAAVLHWAKKFISEHFMRRINFYLGIVLVVLAVYFFASSARVLFWHEAAPGPLRF